MDDQRELQPIVVCRDVHKWYGNFEALKGISMEVKLTEVVVIFGPSGSGKSTCRRLGCVGGIGQFLCDHNGYFNGYFCTHPIPGS